MFQQLSNQEGFSSISEILLNDLQNWVKLKSFIMNIIQDKSQGKNIKTKNQKQLLQNKSDKGMKYISEEISYICNSGYRLIDLFWSIQLLMEKKQIHLNCKFTKLFKTSIQFRPLSPSSNIQLQQILSEISKNVFQQNVKIYLGNDGLVHSFGFIQFVEKSYKFLQIQKVFKDNFKAMKSLMKDTLPKIIDFLVHDSRQFYPIMSKKQKLEKQSKKSKYKQQSKPVSQIQKNINSNDKKSIKLNEKEQLQENSNKLKTLFQKKFNLDENLIARIIVNKYHYQDKINEYEFKNQQFQNMNQSGSLIGNIQRLQGVNSNYSRVKNSLAQISSVQNLVSSSSEETNQKGVINSKLQNIKGNIQKRKKVEQDFKQFLQRNVEKHKLTLEKESLISKQSNNSFMLKKNSLIKPDQKEQKSQIKQDQNYQLKKTKIPKYILSGINITGTDQNFHIQLSHTKNSKIQAKYYQFNFVSSINHFQSNFKNYQVKKKIDQENFRSLKAVLAHKIAIQDQSLKGYFSLSKSCYKNQESMLQFLRNQTSPFIGKYYMRVYKEKQKAIAKDKLYIEYYRKTLFQLIKESKYYKPKIILSLKKKLQILKGIVQGINFLYQRKIIHRDLKPLNIMISKNLTPKIIDFGSCYTNQEKNGKFKIYQPRLLPTQRYYVKYNTIADQEIKKKYPTHNQYNQHLKFDIFSLGVILRDIFQQQIKQNHDFLRLNQIGLQLRNIQQLCISIDPDNRVKPDLILFMILKLQNWAVKKISLIQNKNHERMTKQQSRSSKRNNLNSINEVEDHKPKEQNLKEEKQQCKQSDSI